jgi:hypothetical protein
MKQKIWEKKMSGERKMKSLLSNAVIGNVQNQNVNSGKSFRDFRSRELTMKSRVDLREKNGSERLAVVPGSVRAYRRSFFHAWEGQKGAILFPYRNKFVPNWEQNAFSLLFRIASVKFIDYVWDKK